MKFFYKAGSTIMTTRCLDCGHECEDASVAIDNLDASVRAVERINTAGQFCNAWSALCVCGKTFIVDHGQCIEILSLLDNAA